MSSEHVEHVSKQKSSDKVGYYDHVIDSFIKAWNKKAGKDVFQISGKEKLIEKPNSYLYICTSLVEDVGGQKKKKEYVVKFLFDSSKHHNHVFPEERYHRKALYRSRSSTSNANSDKSYNDHHHQHPSLRILGLKHTEVLEIDGYIACAMALDKAETDMFYYKTKPMYNFNENDITSNVLIIADLLEGLRLLGNQNIVHMDLKMENMLILKNHNDHDNHSQRERHEKHEHHKNGYRAVIGDFGAACDGHHMTYTISGTLKHMPAHYINWSLKKDSGPIEITAFMDAFSMFILILFYILPVGMTGVLDEFLREREKGGKDIDNDILGGLQSLLKEKFKRPPEVFEKTLHHYAILKRWQHMLMNCYLQTGEVIREDEPTKYWYREFVDFYELRLIRTRHEVQRNVSENSTSRKRPNILDPDKFF